MASPVSDLKARGRDLSLLGQCLYIRAAAGKPPSNIVGKAHDEEEAVLRSES